MPGAGQKPHEKNLTQTPLKAFQVLECIAEAGRPLSVTEVAEHTGLARLTAYRLLVTLASSGYVMKDREGSYRLGTKLLILSRGVLQDLDWPLIAHSHLTSLTELTGETTHLGLLDGHEVLYIDKVESRQPVRMFSSINTRNELHCTSMGKAILAFLSEERREKLFHEMKFSQRTSNSITDPAALRLHLEQVRRQGYALDNEENEKGIACAGAPIFDHLDRVIGAVSVSGPAYRLPLSRLEQFSTDIIRTAQTISERIGYQVGRPLHGLKT